MKANKKNYMPGGGMLRNQYQQGGVIPMTEKEKRQLQMLRGVDPIRPNFPRLPDQRSIGQVYGKLQTRVNPPQASNVQASNVQASKPKPPYVAAQSRSSAVMLPTVNVTASKPTQQPATAKTTSPASAPTVKPVSPVKGGSMTFGEAFAAARKQGAKEFEYKGKKYNTMLKGEGVKQTQPAAQRSSETIRSMPSKVATEVGGKYFQSPTGKMAYTPGKSTTANVAAAPMRTASSVSSSASTPPQIRTTMSAAEKEDKKPMSSAARAMMARYMSKYKK